MSISNLIKGAMLSIRTRKLRVFLTMIGIIIGISSVVTILAIGEGLKAEVTKSAQDSSANKIQVYFAPENNGTVSESTNGALVEYFNKQDIYELQKVNGIEKVEANQGAFGGDTTSAMVSYFDKSTNLFISKYNDKELHIEYGRGFNESDANSNFIILSSEDAKNLFKSPDKAIGQGVSINDVMFEVIGVLKHRDGISFDITSNPNSTVIQKHSMEQINLDVPFTSINIYVNPNENKEKVFAEVKDKLKTAHHELKGEYKLQDPQEITKAFEKIIGGVTLFITLVTGISLFVGGIGVMNIMYVSVSERRREIGIRRAIGAKPRSIMLQFLFEAVIVTMIGGVIGIIVGYLCANIAGAFMPFKPVITAKCFTGATLTSVLTGVIFGIMPAYNASKLDPIKAIYK